MSGNYLAEKLPSQKVFTCANFARTNPTNLLLALLVAVSSYYKTTRFEWIQQQIWTDFDAATDLSKTKRIKLSLCQFVLSFNQSERVHTSEPLRSRDELMNHFLTSPPGPSLQLGLGSAPSLPPLSFVHHTFPSCMITRFCLKRF